MNNESTLAINESTTITYLETPRTNCYPERIDAVLERRMKDFLLARRRIAWLTEGE